MQDWVKRAYENSPAFLQNLMISVYGWKLARVRFGGNYPRYVEELEKSQWFSDSEMAELQREKLTGLIRHCYENVPYYSDLFHSAKLTPDDIQNPSDLFKIPILKKEALRSNPERFLAQNLLDHPFEMTATSGTTGTPLAIRVDIEGRRLNYAFYARFKHWAGVDERDRNVIFGSRVLLSPERKEPPFWRHNRAANCLLMSSYHLSERNAPYYLRKLEEWRPAYVETFASSLYVLALSRLQSGAEEWSPKAVFTSSETLHAEYREAIERAFRTRVFDQYGAAEQSTFISECEKGSYHVHPEYGVTEFLPTETEDEFEIVTTSFTNRAMPLLRYRTGDRVTMTETGCECGRKFPRIGQVLGRADDVIRTPDGRRIGRLSPVYKGVTTISLAQVVQEELDRIVLRVVPAPGFRREDVEPILHQLEMRIGKGVRYEVEVVERIAQEGSAKFRNIVSKVGKGGSDPNGHSGGPI